MTSLNHAVLYVRDAARSARFYQDVLAFSVVSSEGGGRAIFLRAEGSVNHHDLGLFTIGAQAALPRLGSSVGLYHLAWEVPTIEALSGLRDKLAAAGALVGASDHGVSKSVYAADPDGIEFEVMWRVPPEHWGDAEHHGVVAPLDLVAEVARYGSSETAAQA